MVNRWCRGILLLVVLLAGSAAAEVAVVGDKLSLDALIWVNARGERVTERGLTRMDFAFYRFWAPVGLTIRPVPGASFRLSFDAGWNERALDIYADLDLPAEFVLRAGQFVPPLGSEALTEPGRLKLIEYSILKGAWKPYDPRDVGIMLMRDRGAMAFSFAVVNGAGRSTWLQDDNKWKDLGARVVYRPALLPGFFVAGRSYYARVGQDGGLQLNYALELGAVRSGLNVTGELQQAIIGKYRITAGYLQSAYRALDWLEPVGRLQASYDIGRTVVFGLTAGANVGLYGNAVRLMVNYDLRRILTPQSASRSTRHQLLLQLQMAL